MAIFTETTWANMQAFTATVRGHEYAVVNYRDHWEVYVKNASTRAWNRGRWSHGKWFATIQEVAQTYKNLAGLDMLVQA